jgi:hypothetical protein
MVSEVPEESVGFLWARVIADLYDIIRRKKEIEKKHEALTPCRFFLEEEQSFLLLFKRDDYKINSKGRPQNQEIKSQIKSANL